MNSYIKFIPEYWAKGQAKFALGLNLLGGIFVRLRSVYRSFRWRLDPVLMQRASAHPIVFAASVLGLVTISLVCMGSWRLYTDTSIERDQPTSVPLLQSRAIVELGEKTKYLEQSLRETVDQAQTVAEQLQVMKGLIITQQAETDRISGQIDGINQSVDNLRQSFASARGPEISSPSRKRRSWRRKWRS